MSLLSCTEHLNISQKLLQFIEFPSNIVKLTWENSIPHVVRFGFTWEAAASKPVITTLTYLIYSTSDPVRVEYHRFHTKFHLIVLFVSAHP